MPIYICPYCSARTALTDDQRGTTIECPHCQMDGVAYGVSGVEDPAEHPAPPIQPLAEQQAPAPSTEPAATHVDVQWVGPGGPMPAGKTTHPCAILSLVCGIVGLFAATATRICCCALPMLMLCVGAIVVGIVALGQIKAQPTRYSGRGMAIAGIVLGTIGPILALIGLVALLILPRLGYVGKWPL